jgi:hypothetical protein
MKVIQRQKESGQSPRSKGGSSLSGNAWLQAKSKPSMIAELEAEFENEGTRVQGPCLRFGALTFFSCKKAANQHRRC